MTTATDSNSDEFTNERIVIDDATIDSDDPMAVIDPVWWEGDIYGTYAAYEDSLSRFTPEQRLAFALMWYDAEVNNGGHDQFFSNSTGIVWKDALEAASEIKAKGTQSILEEAANRMGGSPSFNREERWSQLERNQKGFEDLDDRFYSDENDLYPKLIQYIKDNRPAFYFDGIIRKPSLP